MRADGTAWFTDGHGNLGAAALSHTTALVAYKALASMTEKDSGNPLGLLDGEAKPALVYPVALMETGEKIAGEDFYYTTNDLTTKVPNPLKGKVTPVMLSLLTDTSDWYMVLNHDFWKPFAFIAPEDIQTVLADVNNSDRAREFNENIIYTHIRTALGVFFPGCVIKINN